MQTVDRILIVGGGTAGFMAALSLKTKLPAMEVTVVRSPEIGIIGVGEGSAPPFTLFLHRYLNIPIPEFVRATRPGLKLGTCFIWGPRPRFFFPFGPHMSIKIDKLPKAVGYYLDHGDPEAASIESAKMQANRTFFFDPKGQLSLTGNFAYHVENDRFADFLEQSARRVGVRVVDGTVENVRRDDTQITGVDLAGGQALSADLYVDCSGFRALLVGKTFGEPYVDYRKTLLCDRAVVGGWARPAGEPMVPYTIAETMDSGWCWKIDHPDRINRGYVYSSAFITDDEAEREFRAKNPMVGPTRVVKFVSGRYARSWVGNVVAMGNASGFVEPLEATSLAVNAMRCVLLTDMLMDADRTISQAMVDLYNDNTAKVWDSIRDFLSLHYRFNTKLDTPFWRTCRAEVDFGGALPLVEYYRHVGPSPALAAAYVDRNDIFNVSSYHAILSGQNVPYRQVVTPTADERVIWQSWCRENAARAQQAATVEQALAILGR